MLDIGWPELLLIGVITVLVVGPKELPRVLRTVTQFVRKAQGLAREFQTGMNDLARQADLDDIRKDMKDVERDTTGQVKIDQFDRVLDPDNSIAGMFTGRPISTPAPAEAARSPGEPRKTAPAGANGEPAAPAVPDGETAGGSAESSKSEPDLRDLSAVPAPEFLLPVDFPPSEPVSVGPKPGPAPVARQAEPAPEREKRRAEA